MSIIWRKALRDLWRSKLRTVLVIVSTTTGVLALGLVFGLSDSMSERLADSHVQSRPAHITFYTSRFDLDIVDAIRHEPGVAETQGETVALVNWKLEGDADWQDGIVISRADFTQDMNRLELLDGTWPGHSRRGRTLAVEHLTSRHYDLSIGAEIVVDVGLNGRRIPIEAIARDSQAAAPPLTPAIFLASPDTIAWLTDLPESFNRLHVRMASFDEQQAGDLAKALEDRLERMGVVVGMYVITDPNRHPVQEIVDSMKAILSVLGGLSLALSGFLIINVMNATVAQQMWQIGVMKVIGATRRRIVGLYLTTALFYGMIALIPAIPLAALIAYPLERALLNLFNVSSGPLQVTPSAVTIQVVVGLALPVLAALVPVLGGARVTPHRAIGTYGLGAGFGGNWLDRLVGRVRRLPRVLAISLRNTFRRKARIALTMITLVLGGVMFMMIMSVSASMTNTVDVLLSQLGYDVIVAFDRLYREGLLVQVAESVEGVVLAEVWDQRLAELATESGEELETTLLGVPSDSRMFAPNVISGRALLPGDRRAILLNNRIAADGGFQIGDEVSLTIADHQSTWTVVGLIVNANQTDSYVPFDELARAGGYAGRGALVLTQGREHDAFAQLQLIDALRDAYTRQGMEPRILQSAAEVRQLNQAQFDVITYLMMSMAVLAAVVGSIGLMSTMSINVAEQRREIGVMRAIGAQSASLLAIFVIEGMLVGVMSWLFAVPISYPGSIAFNQLVGSRLFGVPLDFKYSIGGTIGWLAIVIFLSSMASLWPALRATQVSVREALSYE